MKANKTESAGRSGNTGNAGQPSSGGGSGRALQWREIVLPAGWHLSGKYEATHCVSGQKRRQVEARDLVGPDGYRRCLIGGLTAENAGTIQTVLANHDAPPALFPGGGIIGEVPEMASHEQPEQEQQAGGSADVVAFALEAIGALATGATVALIPAEPGKAWGIAIDGQPVADFSNEGTARAVHCALARGPRLLESPPESFGDLTAPERSRFAQFITRLARS